MTTTKFSMDSHTFLALNADTIKEIRRIAILLHKEVHDKGSPVPEEHFDSPIAHLNLPYPHALLAPISKLSMPEGTHQELKQIFNSRVKELQESCSAAYRNVCRNSMIKSTFNKNSKSISDIFEAQYRDQCLYIFRSLVAKVTNHVSQYNSRISQGAKKPFNYESTPALEKYFEYNGYPSPIHRSILAAKAGLTLRQIEVWFQNHRNRARKEGKTVKRLHSDIALKKALDMLQDIVSSGGGSPSKYEDSGSEIIIPSEHQKSQSTIIQGDSCIDPLIGDSFRPSHAYPATFSRSRLDLFNRHQLPSPMWMRIPATSTVRPSANINIDMDEFTSLFQLKLSFLERKRDATPSPPSGIQPWFSSTVTTLPRERHPACIDTSVTLPSTVTPRPVYLPPQFPAGPRRFTEHNAFGPFVAEEPLSFDHYRPTTSAWDTLSPTPKSSSRTSSFSSDVSYGRRISSSNSSNSSPEPSTPPLLPQCDIVLNPEELVQDGYDFEVFSIINHPDFSVHLVNNMDQPMIGKQPDMTTVDPSLLTYSSSYTNLQYLRGYS